MSNIIVYDKLINTLTGHTDCVNSAAISPDNKKIVSGSNDNRIKIWDLESGELINTLKGQHTVYIYSVAISPDNKKIVSGSYKTIHIWDLESGVSINTLKGHTNWVKSLAISPDNKKIVSGSFDSTICIWNLESGNLIILLINSFPISFLIFEQNYIQHLLTIDHL